MFIEPVIFLCNTLLFVLLLEERFKLITTVAVAGVAYILSLVSAGIMGGIFADPLAAGHASNAFCVLLLLLASVFISSNNFTQKLFVGLLLLSNYAFVTDFMPQLLGALPFEASGIVGILLCNAMYLFFSLLTLIFFAQPLHYFFRRGISPSMIGLCVLQFFCWFVAKGAVNDLFHTASFPLRFFLALFLYLVVLFCFRSIYGGARYKAQDVLQATDDTVIDIMADHFSAMLVNVNAYKTVKKNLDHQLERIAAMAAAGKTQEICDYVELSKRSGAQVALLQDYSENPHINAVVATKTAQAKGKDILLESNIALGTGNLPVVEVCVIINDILALAIEEAQSAAGEKHIRLTLLPTADQLTIEAVYSEGAGDEKLTRLPARTVFSFLAPYFEPKEKEKDKALRNIMDIIEKRSGKIGVSHSDGNVITRVGIHY